MLITYMICSFAILRKTCAVRTHSKLLQERPFNDVTTSCRLAMCAILGRNKITGAILPAPIRDSNQMCVWIIALQFNTIRGGGVRNNNNNRTRRRAKAMAGKREREGERHCANWVIINAAYTVLHTHSQSIVSNIHTAGQAEIHRALLVIK